MPRNTKNEIISEQAKMIDEEMHLHTIYARDAMIKPILFQKEDSIEKVIKKLKMEDCNICIVTDKEMNFFGEIKDEDLIMVMARNALNFPITKVLSRCYKRELSWKRAKDMAIKKRNIVPEDTPINKVLELIYKSGSQNIIVINNNKKVAGVITSSSLLRLLSEY